MQHKKLSENEIGSIITSLIQEKIDKCPKCKSPVKKLKGNKDRYICMEYYCKHRFTPWIGTFFENNKLSKMTILRILEYWLCKMSIDNISYVLDIDKKSVYRVLVKLSKLIIPKFYKSIEEMNLGGENQIIEIDETKLGKRKYNRGHYVEGVWVWGMINRTTKEIKLFKLEDRTRNTLESIIKTNANKESEIYTDCWKGYSQLKFHFRNHGTVNHSRNFKDPETGVHTNTIEGIWHGMKMHIPARNRTKEKIKLYLIRYMILKNAEDHPLKELIKYIK